MNNFQKKGLAFTLMELMIALVIIGVVSIVTVKIISSRTDYIYKYMYNATLKDLKMGVGTLIAEGIADSKGNLYKYLPAAGHTDNEDGFCDRLSSLLNTIGPSDCSKTVDEAGPFDTTTANFITTNGMRFFNFGANPDANNIYTVYVDIDGAKGKSQLNSDVYKFQIDRCGQLLINGSPPTCTVNMPGDKSDPSCGVNGFYYEQDGSNIKQEDTDDHSKVCMQYVCGSNTDGGSGGTAHYTLSSDASTVTKTITDNLSGGSIVCSTDNWACGSSGTQRYYASASSGATVYYYDKTAYADGTNLACSSCQICGTCNETVSCNSGAGTCIATDDITGITCSSATGCPSGQQLQGTNTSCDAWILDQNVNAQYTYGSYLSGPTCTGGSTYSCSTTCSAGKSNVQNNYNTNCQLLINGSYQTVYCHDQTFSQVTCAPGAPFVITESVYSCSGSSATTAQNCSEQGTPKSVGKVTFVMNNTDGTTIPVGTVLGGQMKTSGSVYTWTYYKVTAATNAY